MMIFKPAGILVLPCFLMACAVPAQNDPPKKDSPELTNKATILDQTSTDKISRPTTLDERRELRTQFAELNGKPIPDADEKSGPKAEPVQGEVPDKILNKIIEQFVVKHQASRSSIDVLHAESVVWNDGALGCGKPGQMYTMALVPGYRVVLAHGGQQFDYRVTQNGSITLCEQPGLSAPGNGSRPPTL